MKAAGLLLLCWATCSHAQPIEYPESRAVRLNKDWFRALGPDVLDVVTRPARWQKKEWVTAAGLGALVGVAYWQDDHIRNLILRNRDDDLDWYSTYLFNPAGATYSFVFLAGLYTYGGFTGNGKSKKVALDASRALVLTMVATRATKFISNRERPFEDHPDGLPDDDHLPFEDDQRFESFFSGHTAAAFTIAAVMAHAYKDKKAVPYIAYGLAGAAGISRLYLDKHWTSDVVVGAIVGYYIGRTVTRGDNWKIQVSPHAGHTGSGLSLRYAF